MKKLQTWSALTLAALLTACSNNDNLTPSPANGHYTEALLFNTSVTNPDGKSGVAYMQAINDTTSATYNNRNAESIGYETALVVQGKNIYSMPSFMGGLEVGGDEMATQCSEQIGETGRSCRSGSIGCG